MAEMEGFEPPDGLTRQLISSNFESVAHTSISKQYLVFTIPQNR